MLKNNSRLILGPCIFTHQVQKIAIQERKAVEVLDTARSGVNFIIDSGESEHRAQIRLLFTELDEINEGISSLRGLIALFKVCPIVSLKNNFLTTSWKKSEDLYNKQTYDKINLAIDTASRVNKLLSADIATGLMSKEMADNIQSGVIISKVAYSNEILNRLNKYISNTSGSIERGIVDNITANLENTHLASIRRPLLALKYRKHYSDFVPVALESLELENVPDLPHAIQATITIARVDVSAFSDNDSLQYLQEGSLEHKSDNPEDAYWLKEWILSILKNGQIPVVRNEAFAQTDISWYGDTVVGEVESPHTMPTVRLSCNTIVSKDTDGILIAENSSIRNKFGYNKLIGQLYPSVSYMGCTARNMSLDIVFNNQDNYEGYKKFCLYKTVSDTISKSQERYDRVTGWQITTPISKLLGMSRLKSGGVFVPISVSSQTGDQPDMVNCRIDLIENNLDVVEQSEILLTSGGTDYDDLKTFFNKVISEEFVFRTKLLTSPSTAMDELSGLSTDQNHKSFSLFWPIEKGIITLKNDSSFGLLNIDTARAVLLELDTNKTLLQALVSSALATGKRIANTRVSGVTKLLEDIDLFSRVVFGIDFTDPEINRINKAVLEIVDKFFSNATNEEEIAKQLTMGLLGNSSESGIFSTSITGKFLLNISKSPNVFSQEFTNALFKVIVDRKQRPRDLPYIYSMDGIYSAFYKLIYAYNIYKDGKSQPSAASIISSIKNENYNRDRNKVYPDLMLPSYIELYGDRWLEFAPTFDDLGMDNYGDEELSRSPAVSPDDIVSPAAWFYRKRVKDSLRSVASSYMEGVSDSSPAFSLSVPFNTEEINQIKENIVRKNEAISNGDTNAEKVASDTLSEIIIKSYQRFKTKDSTGFRQDIINIRTAYDKYSDALQSNKPVRLLVHHNGNYVLPREITTAGVGAEIYRVVTESKLFNNLEFGRVDPGAKYVSPIDKSVSFHRHLKESNEACVQSSLTQIADDHYSPERMFPAIKVYLLDRRGSDLIADDVMFNVGSIISVDITLDKEDASLAVIKLADPLYTLQNDYFDKSNIAGKEVDQQKKILGTLRNPEAEGFIKRYKLMQGRSVQIRMGYSSMAHQLPIVFTGRITEIVPGDQLTVVCQGWKAELINRQVSFTCDEPKNYGARDLAIQAITYASPEGFGDFYPEYDAQFILRNLNQEDLSSVIQNSLKNREGIDLETVGTRGFSESALNSIQTLLGFASRDKKNRGFDTRLKNIWYPDTELYNNILGLRTTLNVMPEWINCGWIVPLQPAWNVLKEAARHAWNCIVEVVPYDGEATIFMGHPDQPYYYTRGNNQLIKSYSAFKKQLDGDVVGGLDELLNLFFDSKYYISTDYIQPLQLDGLRQTIDEAITLRQRRRRNLDISEIVGLLGFMKDGDFSRLSKSSLPLSVLNNAKEKGYGDRLPILLFSKFFGISEGTLISTWPTISRDIYQILGRDSETLTPDVLAYIKGITGSISTKNIENTRYQLNKLRDSFYKQKQKFIEFAKGLENRYAGRVGEAYVAIRYEFGALRQLVLSVVEDINTNNKSSTQISDSVKSVISSILHELRGINLQFNGIPTDQSSAQSQFATAYVDKIKEIEGHMAHIVSIFSDLKDSDPPIISALYPSVTGGIVSDLITSGVYLTAFKAFVYYFCSFLIESEDPKVKELSKKTNRPSASLPPNMRVFRVHHYADDVHNIIQNNIVASTREMWNTVVIEHPAPGTADNDIQDPSQIYTNGTVNSGASWVYWPPQEITGVIGLQFHPGLVLGNKKVQVFTEINCQNPDLACKIAQERLAQGIRKMYVGNLLLTGKHIKPYDRIILADAYTKMTGPVEVESVVHHWNTRQGWVTNVIPNAVCDANPGSAVLQTAALETAFNRIFNTIEFVSDIWTYATIIATAGAATPLALGKFSTRKGIYNLAKNLISRGGIKTTIKSAAAGTRRVSRNLLKHSGGIFRKGHRLDFIRYLIKDIGGPSASLLLNETIAATLEFGNNFFWKNTAIQGFVESNEKVEQLPVVLCPLIFNGNAFTAGLETDDAIWAIGAFGTYYSMREMQLGAARFLEDFLSENE